MLITRWVQSRPVMGRCLPALDLLADRSAKVLADPSAKVLAHRSAEVANILISDDSD